MNRCHENAGFELTLVLSVRLILLGNPFFIIEIVLGKNKLKIKWGRGRFEFIHIRQALDLDHRIDEIQQCKTLHLG
jgi:hypothetical protein